MKNLILAGLLASLVLACAEPTSVTRPVVDTNARPDYYEEGPQEPGLEVPPEYNVPTEIHVTAGGGFTRPSTGGAYAYGEAVVNYTATHGLAKAKLEIDGYPDALAVTQDSRFLPRANGIAAIASRTIPDTCGKSSRTEAVGEAWNEYVGLSLLTFGKKIQSETYTALQAACPIRPPGGGGGDVPHCDWYQVQYSDDGGETWQDNGEPQWLCPGDEPAWETRKGRKLDRRLPAAATANRVVMERGRQEKTEASILFVGTHYLDVYAHAYVQSGAKSGVDAVILVDTMRASADDLEAAILAAAYHVNTESLSESQRIVVAKSGVTSAAKARAAERASRILEAVKQSPSQGTVSGRPGRALKTRVQLPRVRSAKSSH